MPAPSSARMGAFVSGQSSVALINPRPPLTAWASPTPGARFSADSALSWFSSGTRTRAVRGAARRLMSATGPSAMTSPRLRMITREHTSSTSSRKWVLRMTVAPRSVAASLISASICRCPAGSRPSVGSSRKSTLGRFTSALATPRRCLIPRLYMEIGDAARSARPTSASSVFAVSRALFRDCPNKRAKYWTNSSPDWWSG